MNAEARELSDDFVGRTGLGRSGRAEAGEGLAAAVEVGVGAGQGQGRVGVARVVLFVAGEIGVRRRIEMKEEEREEGGRDAAMEDGVGGQAAAATSAAAEQGRDGGHGHRPG